jgi:hypothetical protein
MADDSWTEDARGFWQSQESEVTRMSAVAMRERAKRWNRAFAGTNWIAFACAGLFLAFFGYMFAIHGTFLQRAGATMGLLAAIHLVGVGLHIARGPWVDEGATCIRAYKAQLERRRQADQGAARTILLAMAGCALLTPPGDWVPWTLQFAAQLGAGIVAYAYIARGAKRFQARIDELTRLEGD